MKEACKSFVGVHDFRNFCKMDAEKVSNFERTILSYSIAPCPGASTGGTTSGTPLEGTNSGDERMTMWVATIRGHAFLWHQVRNMMAVLFLVGMKLESPDIVSQLLDLSKYPRKPQYSMASGAPLVLFECGFEVLSLSLPLSLFIYLFFTLSLSKHTIYEGVCETIFFQFR
eukprot:Rmarinus@m.19211